MRPDLDGHELDEYNPFPLFNIFIHLGVCEPLFFLLNFFFASKGSLFWSFWFGFNLASISFKMGLLG
jgi:hypothetical protein